MHTYHVCYVLMAACCPPAYNRWSRCDSCQAAESLPPVLSTREGPSSETGR